MGKIKDLLIESSEDSHTVLVQETKAYGQERYQAINELAKLFCDIAKAKTLTKQGLKLIAKVPGIKVKIVTTKLEFKNV